MDINIKHIVPAKDLSLDVPLIQNRLATQEKIVVFEDNTPQFVIIPISAAVANRQPMKVGEYVQTATKELFANRAISKEEITKLLTLEYSKSIFNIPFPILKEVDSNKPLTEQKRDTKGYNRYYNFTLTAYGKQYLLCSQWFEPHYDSFETWYLAIKANARPIDGSIESAFRIWMETRAKKRGEGVYEAKTIESYTWNLRSCATKLTNVSILHTNMFEYESLPAFLKDMESIQNATNFEEIDLEGHRAFSNALKRYKEFLEEREFAQN
ncbi:MAG: hypothetical protein LBV04_07920 [Deferribacteraceae bacterium]|jgi:hypothetical protein|nr:hypothetical protein [Deferribacteraceae bacterium]